MKLPFNELVEKNLSCASINVYSMVDKYMAESFTGYFIVSILGYSGFEEGVIIFRHGQLVGSVFEYNKYNIVVFGFFALQQFFNAVRAKFSVMDIVSLSVHQVDLITAFNDKIMLENPISLKEISKLIPPMYSDAFAKRVLSDVLLEDSSKQSALESVGLSGAFAK